MSRVLIFPTDTVYGMGVSIYDKEGQDKIYQLKERPTNKRLSVLCANYSDIANIAEVTEDAKKIIDEFMPGALTIILKSKEEIVSDYIYDTIAVRIPNHPIALRVLAENGPMATTSVNISGSEPMNDYVEIYKKFNDKVFYIYPNAEAISNISSTIIDLTTTPYQLIREGSVKFNDVMKFLNK
jgi:L-threonylcarbamoyladenylate synthase